MINIEQIEMMASPNWSERAASVKVDAVIMHYTAGGHYKSSARWLCNPAAKASAHFVVGRKGQVVQLVSTEKTAWHAGTSEYRDPEGTIKEKGNRSTLGIEIANHGLLEQMDGKFFYRLGRTLRDYKRAPPEFATLKYQNGHEVSGWWEPYPMKQILAVKWLLEVLESNGYADAVANLQGHDEIAKPLGRKMDPGPLFPWEMFQRANVRHMKSRSSAST